MSIPREDVGDLFPLYPVSVAALEEQGRSVAARADGLVAVRDEVAAAHGVALDAVGGLLVAPMDQAVRPTLASLRGWSARRRWPVPRFAASPATSRRTTPA